MAIKTRLCPIFTLLCKHPLKFSPANPSLRKERRRLSFDTLAKSVAGDHCGHCHGLGILSSPEIETTESQFMGAICVRKL
jgi:hypothetical protein